MLLLVVMNSLPAAYQAGWFPGSPGVFPEGGMVHVLSVGDGQALLLQCPFRAAMIGAGPEWAAPAVVRYLRAHRVYGLQAAIMADTNYDHASGLKLLMERLPVGAFFDASAPATGGLDPDLLAVVDRLNVPYHRLWAGQRLDLGCMEVRVLAPPETGGTEEGITGPIGDSPGVFLIEGASHRILYAGNADAATEKSLIRLYPDLQAEVLIVARGGHMASTSQVFLEHVQPELAIIPVGSYNEEGRPHRDVLNRLENSGIRIIRTDLHGTVVLGLAGGPLHVTLQRHLVPAD